MVSNAEQKPSVVPFRACDLCPDVGACECGETDCTTYGLPLKCQSCNGTGFLPGTNYVAPSKSGPPSCFRCNGQGVRVA